MTVLDQLPKWFERKPLVLLRLPDGFAQALSESKHGLNRFTLVSIRQKQEGATVLDKGVTPCYSSVIWRVRVQSSRRLQQSRYRFPERRLQDVRSKHPIQVYPRVFVSVC
jgi:hypothetical protein